MKKRILIFILVLYALYACGQGKLSSKPEDTSLDATDWFWSVTGLTTDKRMSGLTFMSYINNTADSVRSELADTAVALRIIGEGTNAWSKSGNHVYLPLTDSVGIGTNSPTQKLHVVGNEYLTGALYQYGNPYHYLGSPYSFIYGSTGYGVYQLYLADNVAGAFTLSQLSAVRTAGSGIDITNGAVEWNGPVTKATSIDLAGHPLNIYNGTLSNIISLDDDNMVLSATGGMNIKWNNDSTYLYNGKLYDGRATAFGFENAIDYSSKIILNDDALVTSLTLKNYVDTAATSDDANISWADSSKIYLGELAGSSNTGAYSISIGYGAGRLNTESNQVSIGYYAGLNNIGADQVSIGLQSGQYNEGVDQLALGNFSGQYNTGYQETAIGTGTGQYNSGDQANFFGSSAGYYNEGNYVNGFGENNLQYNKGNAVNTIGNYNASYNIGDSSLFLGNYRGIGNTVNGRIEIDPTNENSPLIKGNAYIDSLGINGLLSVRDSTNAGIAIKLGNTWFHEGDIGGGSVTPAGSTGNIQINNAGAFGYDANLSYGGDSLKVGTYYTFDADRNTGIGRAGDDQLSLKSGGIEIARLYLDSFRVFKDIKMYDKKIYFGGVSTSLVNFGTSLQVNANTTSYVLNQSYMISNPVAADGFYIRTTGSSLTIPMYASYLDQNTGISMRGDTLKLIAGGSNKANITASRIVFNDSIALGYLGTLTTPCFAVITTGNAIDTGQFIRAGFVIANKTKIPSFKEYYNNIKDGERLWPTGINSLGNFTYTRILPNNPSSITILQAKSEMQDEWMYQMKIKSNVQSLIIGFLFIVIIFILIKK